MRVHIEGKTKGSWLADAENGQVLSSYESENVNSQFACTSGTARNRLFQKELFARLADATTGANIDTANMCELQVYDPTTSALEKTMWFEPKMRFEDIAEGYDQALFSKSITIDNRQQRVFYVSSDSTDSALRNIATAADKTDARYAYRSKRIVLKSDEWLGLGNTVVTVLDLDGAITDTAVLPNFGNSFTDVKTGAYSDGN